MTVGTAAEWVRVGEEKALLPAIFLTTRGASKSKQAFEEIATPWNVLTYGELGIFTVAIHLVAKRLKYRIEHFPFGANPRTDARIFLFNWAAFFRKNGI